MHNCQGFSKTFIKCNKQVLKEHSGGNLFSCICRGGKQSTRRKRRAGEPLQMRRSRICPPSLREGGVFAIRRKPRARPPHVNLKRAVHAVTHYSSDLIILTSFPFYRDIKEVLLLREQHPLRHKAYPHRYQIQPTDFHSVHRSRKS